MVVAMSSSQKENPDQEISESKSLESSWRRKWTSLHDGSVNDRLDVVLSVSRVDHPLSFGVLFDVILCKELKTHV